MKIKSENQRVQELINGLRSSGRSSRRMVEFVIHVPAMKPGQTPWTRVIKIPVFNDGNEEILTPEAHELIDRIKTQMTLRRLIDVVRELTGS